MSQLCVELATSTFLYIIWTHFRSTNTVPILVRVVHLLIMCYTFSPATPDLILKFVTPITENDIVKL
jgi:hypothetical protein